MGKLFVNKVKKTYKFKSGKKKYPTKPVVSKDIKSYVKKKIHANIENKINNTTSVANAITSYYINNNLFTLSCIPYAAITQGVGQGQRIGNLIRTRSCYFNFVIRPAPYSASTNPYPIPQVVMIFFGKVKNSRAQQPISSDYAKIWQTGSTTNAPYSNTLDLIATLNTDWFTVYKTLMFKIGFAQADAASGSNPAQEYYQNNDYKLNVIKKVNITQYMPKNVKFNDTTTQPTNDGLWMWAMCVPADGSQGTASVPTYMDYNMTYTYEDA